MRDVNLIPAHRRDARRRRTIVRWCAVACAGYAVAAVAVGATCLGVWPAPTDADRKQIEQEDQHIAQKERAITTARARVAAANLTLDAERRVSEQPDWSVLLALLADKAGDQIVLKSCRVAPASAGDAKPVAALSGAALLTVEAGGVGRSQLAVSQFLLRLERTGLFAKVALVDTHREGFLTGEAVAFRIEASLSGREESR